VFAGIGDTRTLEAVSLLAGEHEVPTVSISRGPRRNALGALGRGTTRTVSMRKDRILPVDEIARGHRGCVLGIEGAKPGFVQMTPLVFELAVARGRHRGPGERSDPTGGALLGSDPSGHQARDRAIGFR